MKLNSIITKILTNKWVLNIISIVAFLNVIGYMIMGNLNNVLIFIILAVLVRYFSKNMIIVLGVPLIFVNLFTLKNRLYEGMENSNKEDKDNKNKTDLTTTSKETQETQDKNSEKDIDPSNTKSDEHFEVGRPKNGSSKIDYAATIESAYDELNKVLGSDGIKNLTEDTQKLMKQQTELAKSMEGLAPIVEKMMPMAEKMQGMMESMNTGSGGMSNIMDMANKMAKGLGVSNKTN